MPLPKKLTPVALLLAAALALLSLLALARSEARPEHSLVARGEGLAQASGCYACHAPSEPEPRRNFRASSSGAYRPRGIPSFWENGIESGDLLKEWIRDGVPAGERERHQRFLVQMPAYGDGFLDEEEIEALAAWILAKGLSLTDGMGNGELEVPETLDVQALSSEELFVYGDRIARRNACYQCHGELGQGGVANPKSFKGYIPGFFGKDFLDLTEQGDREEIAHWIDHGRGRAIEQGLTGRLAKRYFDRQATGMPGYDGLIRENEKEALVEYLLLLNQMGPLGTGELETLNQRLLQAVLREANP